MQKRFPKAQGLYDPSNEHDNCGIGFVAHIKGQQSHDIVERGLVVLQNMDHRGATSADNITGDGAGILIQVPHAFIVSEGIKVPEAGKYGTGHVFLPVKEEEAECCKKIVEKYIKAEGLELIEWREVPVNKNVIGEIAGRTEPKIVQIFISGKGLEQDALERKLYLVRKTSRKRSTRIIAGTG